MTTAHHVDLPDNTPVVAKAIWMYNRGTSGSLSDAPGWELQECWVPGRPTLSLSERKHIESQLTPPHDHRNQ